MNEEPREMAENTEQHVSTQHLYKSVTIATCVAHSQ